MIPRGRVLLVSLLGLLVLAQVQHSVLVLGEVWWSILSWDNAATQPFDVRASLTPPCEDPSPHASQPAIDAAHPLDRLPIPDGLISPRGAVLSGPISRSPPAHHSA